MLLLLAVPFGRRAVRTAVRRWRSPSLAVTGGAGVLGRADRRTVPQLILGDMLVLDQFAVFFKLLVLIASAHGDLLMSAGFLERRATAAASSALVLFATLGMMVMASGANLASLYVGLELMALSVYVLVGYFKLEVRSNEAAVKYFVLGALSSGILLYGISLVYGALGTLDLADHPVPRWPGCPRTTWSLHARHPPGGLRHAVQGRGGAVPRVDARRLRGRADAGHRLHVGGPQGGRLRHVPAPVRGRLRAARSDHWRSVLWLRRRP